MQSEAVCTLESISPLSMSRHYTTPERDEKETALDYEKRTWRERMHYHPETNEVFIPPMAFKLTLAEAARFLSLKIVGKGKQTYTKHFESGILCLTPLMLGVQKDEVPGEWLFVPADGRRGGGTRVDRCFPRIDSWKGQVTFTILDATITKDVFAQHLREAGNFIGLLRFRPRQNGFYGRFECTKLEWRQIGN